MTNWLTKSEETNFQETSSYDETIEYCHRLESASPWIRYQVFGKSLQGRDLPLLVVSKKDFFSPEQVKKSNAAVLLILNGIHSGEIAGKEASLMLLRDLVLSKDRTLPENVVILVVPIYNVDGHERKSPYNRINQNGPKEMGWRATAQNLNLNRDWMKVDQPETQALLRMYSQWLPDLVIDNHVSDGADFQYDLTYIIDDHPGVAESLRKYFNNDLEPALVSYLHSKNHLVTRYFELRDPNDLNAGIEVGPIAPRYSNGYGTLQNRPTMVIETHMLKSFGTRILAHYHLMEGVLNEISRAPEKLREAVRKADAETIAMKSEYPVKLHLNPEKSEPFLFHGVEFTTRLSDISGSLMIEYGSKPLDLRIPSFQQIEPTVSIAPPLAYAIPPEWTQVIQRLDDHGIQYTRLATPLTAKFETYRFSEVTWATAPFEGRHRVSFKTQKVREERTLPAGSAVVRMNQRTNQLILGLLEPDAEDSLISWGFFQPIFEQKENAEAYVLEKLAREMLKKNAKLRAEFERRLTEDPQFASSPDARLKFFFEHSIYWDRQKDAYPIVRIIDESHLR